MQQTYKPLRNALAGCALALATMAPAGLWAQSAAPDNSGHNKEHQTTADQQKENSSDRETTAKIRRSLMADKSLSTYAHNVKIITQNGAVTLKGPVRTDQEKQAVESAAAGVAGAGKVTNQLTVKQ